MIIDKRQGRRASYEVVCKLETWEVRVCVLEVDDHKLLVLVCG